MSERAFFTLRYALPGYTFILMTFLVIIPNLDGLLSISNLTENGILFTAFLTFFTLLSGGAIGFLVSQVWYFVHNSLLKGQFVKETRNYLQEKFNLSDDVSRQLIFLDYVFHTSDKSPVGYVQRRLDLKHILGSTIFSIIFGGLLGFLIRIEVPLKHITLGTALSSINFQSSIIDFYYLLNPIAIKKIFINYAILTVTIYDFILLVIAAGFIAVLYIGFRKISREHSYMADVVIHKIVEEGDLSEDKARKYFSNEYFN